MERMEAKTQILYLQDLYRNILQFVPTFLFFKPCLFLLNAFVNRL